MLNIITQIELDESFEVKTSSCECPLKFYKCHHVASALLFGLESCHRMQCGSNVKIANTKDCLH